MSARNHTLHSINNLYWFVLNRCTTGTELGGKLPYSVMTSVMFSVGVTSYIMFRMFKFGISLHLLNFPTRGWSRFVDMFVRSSGKAARILVPVLIVWGSDEYTQLIGHNTIQPNLVCELDALTTYNNGNLKLLCIHSHRRCSHP